MSKLTSLFYSKNANTDLAYQTKNILNKSNYFTIYVQDIDDILLKKFINVHFLILDYTDYILDEKSSSLITKLVEQGYIKRILIIKSSIDNSQYQYPSVEYNFDFNENLNRTITKILLTPIQEFKVCDSLCIKIIGNYLTSIGFSLKHIGYSMLIDAIAYLYANNCIMKNLNNDIYVYLANKYEKKVSAVEMNLRKSITLAHARNRNFPFKHSPSNKEFIIYTITELYDKMYANIVI